MKNHTIGGQAVIEGVMMKSSKGWAVAVRSPEGDIVIKSEEFKKHSIFTRIPLIRGFFILLETLLLGLKAIDFSSKVVFKEEKSSPWGVVLSLFLALLAGVLLFIVIPLYITRLAGYIFEMVSTNSLVFNLIDGILRVFVFTGYVFAISLWTQMKRIFAYHGAEHKTINAFESGDVLNPEYIKKYSRLHVRCGTSFLFIVLVISIIVFSMIPPSWSFFMKATSRLVLLPFIAGVSYEVLKLSARWQSSFIGKIIIFPGLLFQRITTVEPDNSQIEVACEALKAVLNFQKGGNKCLKN